MTATRQVFALDELDDAARCAAINNIGERSVIELLNNNDWPRMFNADGTLAPSQFWAADTVKCVVCLTDMQVSGDDGHICSHCEYNL
jgi:hypothetical protein